eukprot:scaffold13468_cov95-Skeletonema_dohrnii-CCMP3373.AAC.4
MDTTVKLRMEEYASSMVRNLERCCAAEEDEQTKLSMEEFAKNMGQRCTNNVIKGGVCIKHGAKVEHNDAASIDASEEAVDNNVAGNIGGDIDGGGGQYVDLTALLSKSRILTLTLTLTELLTF